MTAFALVVRTSDHEEHISNPLEHISTPAQATELIDHITQGDVTWVAFPAGVRHVAIPIEEVVYLAIAPIEDDTALIRSLNDSALYDGIYEPAEDEGGE